MSDEGYNDTLGVYPAPGGAQCSYEDPTGTEDAITALGAIGALNVLGRKLGGSPFVGSQGYTNTHFAGNDTRPHSTTEAEHSRESQTSNRYGYTSSISKKEVKRKSSNKLFWSATAISVCASGIMFYEGVFGKNMSKQHNIPVADAIGYVEQDVSVSQDAYMIMNGKGKNAYRLGARGKKIWVTLPENLVINVIARVSDGEGGYTYRFETGKGRFIYYTDDRYLKRLPNHSVHAGDFYPRTPQP